MPLLRAEGYHRHFSILARRSSFFPKEVKLFAVFEIRTEVISQGHIESNLGAGDHAEVTHSALVVDNVEARRWLRAIGYLLRKSAVALVAKRPLIENRRKLEVMSSTLVKLLDGGIGRHRKRRQ